MSSALAIASVSAVLKNLFDNGLVDDSLATMVGDVTVTLLAPDLIDSSSASQINLFLYQVTPNSGWRNAQLPSRDHRGDRLTNPPLALDLHYMLTVYGKEPYHSEILLGYAMQLLHENPVLTREAIRETLGHPPVLGGASAGVGTLPDRLRGLSTSELAEQIELIKITPEPMGTEEISKMWTAFQSSYRTTAAYVASVVLIQRRQPTRTPLPVRTRKLYAQTLRRPVIEKIRSQVTAIDPVLENEPILAGHRLVLVGSQLSAGEDTLVRIGDFEETPAGPADISDSSVTIALPAGLQAGVHGAQIVHEISMGSPPVPHLGIESNLCPFVLSPEITALASTGSVAGSDVELQLTVNPAVGEEQRVAVILNELVPVASPPLENPPTPRSYRFDVSPEPSSPPAPQTNLAIPVDGVAAGIYILRILVDGAASALETDTDGRYNGPLVTIQAGP